jgi:hypothetical protein
MSSAVVQVASICHHYCYCLPGYPFQLVTHQYDAVMVKEKLLTNDEAGVISDLLLVSCDNTPRCHPHRARTLLTDVVSIGCSRRLTPGPQIPDAAGAKWLQPWAPTQSLSAAGEANLVMKYGYGQDKHLMTKTTPSPDVDDVMIAMSPWYWSRCWRVGGDNLLRHPPDPWTSPARDQEDL